MSAAPLQFVSLEVLQAVPGPFRVYIATQGSHLDILYRGLRVVSNKHDILNFMGTTQSERE